MGKDFPSQFGRSADYTDPNSAYSVKPAATAYPTPQWYADTVFRWTLQDTIIGGNTPLQTGWLFTGQWATPAFDLRPELRSGQSGPKAGVPIASDSARLFVQISVDSQGLNAQQQVGLANMQVVMQESISTTFDFSGDKGAAGIPAGLGLLPSSYTNVTSKFNPPWGPSGPNSAVQTVLATFSPPGTTAGRGEGYPVRYWRIVFYFSILTTHDLPLPPGSTYPEWFQLQAAMY